MPGCFEHRRGRPETLEREGRDQMFWKEGARGSLCALMCLFFSVFLYKMFTKSSTKGSLQIPWPSSKFVPASCSWFGFTYMLYIL